MAMEEGAPEVVFHVVLEAASSWELMFNLPFFAMSACFARQSPDPGVMHSLSLCWSSG